MPELRNQAFVNLICQALNLRSRHCCLFRRLLAFFMVSVVHCLDHSLMVAMFSVPNRMITDSRRSWTGESSGGEHSLGISATRRARLRLARGADGGGSAKDVQTSCSNETPVPQRLAR